MKILKYFIPNNYYKYAVNRFLALLYPKNKTKIMHTNIDSVDMLVRANEDVGKAILAKNFEITELNYIKSQLSNNDVFFDIGANTGFFSLIVASKSNSIQVHAFDPIKINTCLLSSSIEINGFSNIVVNQTCVGNYDGIVEFSLSSDSAYSSILDSGRKTEIKKIKLPITKLDSYINNMKINKIDFIKIDVEGAEKLVIEGASTIFSTPSLRPKCMMIELCDINLKAFQTSIKEIVALIIAKDYQAFVINDNKLEAFDYKIHANKYYNIFFHNTKCIQ